jgi:serine/threonine protein kinase
VTLAAGTKLGPYEIVTPLGAGGMGEVYRAKDPRLGREVAIKVLPASLAGDADRLHRFEQEARSASALNHPNIVTIYEIGTSGADSYIAMEVVEGTSLRATMAGGPLPTRKLLEIGAQIADGLAKAHAAGIVHRDLKPENVMVSKDGFVKLLDFGLAKLFIAPTEQTSGALTIAPQETQPGTVLGTVGYMSPEQAAGRSVDFRSDQFALGSILYEMATGKRAFQKPTGAETLSAIIRDEPESVERLKPAGAGAVAMDRRAMPREGPRGPLRLDARFGAGLEVDPRPPFRNDGDRRAGGGSGAESRRHPLVDGRGSGGRLRDRRALGRPARLRDHAADVPAADLPAWDRRRRALQPRRADRVLQRRVGGGRAAHLLAATGDSRVFRARAPARQPARHLEHRRDGRAARAEDFRLGLRHDGNARAPRRSRAAHRKRFWPT